MVRLLETIRCDKTVNWNTIWRQFTGKLEDSPSTDHVSSSSRIRVCLPVCMYVFLSQTNIALCLNINFSDSDVPKSKQPQLVITVVILDHPGTSGGERVWPVFHGLWARPAKSTCLHVCLSVCLPQALYSPCLTPNLFRITNLYMLSIDKLFVNLILVTSHRDVIAAFKVRWLFLGINLEILYNLCTEKCENNAFENSDTFDGWLCDFLIWWLFC